MTIGDGPGVPETVKARKKTLAEFSVFSVTQKTRRDPILTILGSTLRLTFGLLFEQKKTVFYRPAFFYFCDVFGGAGGGGVAHLALKSLNIPGQFHHAVLP